MGVEEVADRVAHGLLDVGGEDPARRWWPVADVLLMELADAAPPLGRMPRTQAREIVWDALAQMRRDRPPGEGIVLSTLHGAKGLEFPHVLMLDADRRVADVEEDRRLFYVGMTRARETLTLLCRDDTAHPRVAEVAAHLLARRPAVSGIPSAIDRQVGLIGLEDLFIDWAGRQPQGAAVHAALAALKPGHPLRLAWPERGNGELRTQAGVTVVCLSAKGDRDWRPRARSIDKITLHAVLARLSGDSGEDWRAKLRRDVWEIPVAEVWWHPEGTGEGMADDVGQGI